MLKLKLLLLLSFLLALSACGGGGGGSSSSDSGGGGTTTWCINSQVTGCSYNAADPTQTNFGWWIGTRIVGSTTENAYFSADSLGNFQVYIGSNLTQAYLEGTSSFQGSVMSLRNGTIGDDSLATVRFNPILNGNNGGVITNRIMSYVQSNYNSTTPMTMSYTYNTAGDNALSNYLGNYSSGSSSLSIQANGQISATYPAPLFIAFNPTQMCSITTTVSTSTLMKNVVISGTDSCSQSVSMRLYYFTSSNVGQLVLRLTLANNQSPRVVIFN